MTANTRLPPIVQAALRWHKQGATVLRCEAKAPIDKGWTTLDPEELLRRFVEEPSSQVGLRMGLQRSGKLLLALDIDGATGRASLEALESELGKLPPTLSQRTGGGGLHHVFVWPASRANECPTVSKSKLAPGIDVRARGGQIIGAPSPHESGTPYAIMEGRSEVGIVEFPNAWVDRVTETHAAAPAREMHSRANEHPAPREVGSALTRASAYVSKMPPSISGSGGHEACWRAAQVAARGFGLGFNDTLRVLLDFNARCEPPWSRKELEHKAEQAISKSRMPLGMLLQSDETSSAAHDHDAWSADWDEHPADPADADLEREAIEQECETVQEAVAAVAQRPAASKRLQPRADNRQTEKFVFPGQHDSAAEPPPAPKAEVPEPERWTDDRDEMSDPPPLPRTPRGALESIDVEPVEQHLLATLTKAFERIVWDSQRFWIYRSGIFEPLPSWWILKAAKQYSGVRNVAGDAAFRANVTNLKAIEKLLSIDLSSIQNTPTESSYFDDTRCLSVFGNGAWTNGDDDRPTWGTHSPDHKARFRHSFDYVEGLRPEKFIDVLRDWFRGYEPEEIEKCIEAIRAYCGLVLLGALHKVKITKALMLVGAGADGKSSLIELLCALMPPRSTSHSDPADLSDKSATRDLKRAALAGRLLNVCDDCSGQDWHDTSFLKTAIDGRSADARRIGSDVFSFRCVAGHVYAANALPRVHDKSHGFFRRFLCLRFPHSIAPEHRDAKLVQKLVALERQAIVCWMVDAALEMLRGERPSILPEPACHADLIAQWAAGNDSVTTFVADYCEDAGPEKRDWTPTAQLYDAYVMFCGWCYGAFRAQRETHSKDEFAKTLSRMKGVRLEKYGKNNVRVVNRRARRTEDDQ